MGTKTRLRTRGSTPAQPFGPVGISTSLVLGGMLAGLGGLGLAYGAFGGPDARAARLVVGACFAIIGLVVVRMGVARRDWRPRHPGVDPLTPVKKAGANVGSPFGNDSRTARVGRWVLVAVCAVVMLVSVLSLIRLVTGTSQGGAGAVALVVALGLPAGVLGVMSLRRSRRAPLGDH